MNRMIVERYMFVGCLCIIALLSGCSEYDSVSPKSDPIYEPVRMPEKAMVMADQSRNAIIISDLATNKVVWSWDPVSAKMPASSRSWFVNPSECKPVMDNRCILMTASGGAVALIRIADHKVLFYAYCGSNPHSAELLPDGNIVTAESYAGEISTFVVDTVKVFGVKADTKKIGNAHNVVWDAKRNCLYATGTLQGGVTAVFRFSYNGDRLSPMLQGQKRIYTFENESGGHDLFPVQGKEGLLWLTAASAVYQLDVSKEPVSCEKVYDITDVKSIANDGNDIYLLKPTEEWWAEGPVDPSGNVWFQLKGSRLYKCRLMQPDTFSYHQ